MVKYHAVFSVDTGFFRRLDGKYEIEGFVLRPCLITPKNQHTVSANFTLGFDFNGLDETTTDSSEEARRRFINDYKAGRMAKEFVAWFVLATREWAKLSSQSSGHLMKYGPSTHIPVNDFEESILERVFHVDRKVKDGEFFDIERPSFSFGTFLKAFKSVKLPSDFTSLTKKLFSLKKELGEKFLNACFSHQFALENWMPYPTVSILSLVSAVESMMVDEYTIGFCKDANKACPLKKDVMKKFRVFFERNLLDPLPKKLKNFLNEVYFRRSTYVHTALLGKGEVRGIQFGYRSEEVWRLRDEQKDLEKLVNAALMEWIQRI